MVSMSVIKTESAVYTPQAYAVALLETDKNKKNSLMDRTDYII